ncbi:MAG: DUF4491 family protein [Microbacter sp.]
MSFYGVIIGAVSFLIIGLFHPLVIKAEYYWGQKSRWAFLVVGLVAIAASLWVHQSLLGAILGVFGFSCLWSIKEVKEQEQRVKEGRFPKNPRRHATE